MEEKKNFVEQMSEAAGCEMDAGTMFVVRHTCENCGKKSDWLHQPVPFGPRQIADIAASMPLYDDLINEAFEKKGWTETAIGWICPDCVAKSRQAAAETAALAC